MLTVLTKVIVIFSLVAVGWIANKLNVLPDESNDYLVRLLLDITCPCLIFESIVTQKLNHNTIVDVSDVVLGSIIYFVAGTILSLVIIRIIRYRPKSDWGIISATIVGCNTGFMGFPITKAIFGNYAFFLMVMENIVLIVYMYTLMIFIINMGSDEKKSPAGMLHSLVNMCTISTAISIVVFLLQLKVPGPLMDFTTLVGDATIPLSMIVVGVQLGRSDLKKVAANGKLIFACLCSLLLMPALTFLAVNWLPIPRTVKLVLIFAACFPGAVAQVPVAANEGKNATLMAEGVALTTLLSIATLPAAAMILMQLYL